jgi:hypothetical protein
MTRRVESMSLHGGGAGAVDTYFDKVVKYIPADVVAAWVAVTGIIANAGADVPSGTVLWICFAFGVVFTPIWVFVQTKRAGLPPAYIQVAIATGAFVIWVLALGGPFATLSWYQPLYGSLALIGYTLVVGVINQK